MRAEDMTRSGRQAAISRWARECFGVEEATSPEQRGLRLLEEAIEAAQAAGVDRDAAANLVRFVYSRPVGEVAQELGGVAVCALALAEAVGADAETEECREIDRVLAIDRAHFTARNAAKNAAGFHFKVPPR
jgi:NTP pyrophosphatase (non-canonical NTP hydrolase)